MTEPAYACPLPVSGCNPNTDTAPILMRSHLRVAFQQLIPSDSGLSSGQDACGGQQAVSLR